MTLIPEFGLGPREDDEGLFSRDIDGQLVRLDAPTAADYEKTATVQVNGQSVELPVAAPLKDSQGNIVLDLHGRTTPRHTTILDAVVKLNAEKTPLDKAVSITTLCHQQHMTPVAVCRLCMVQVYGQRKGRRTPERKLLPACQHQIKDGMEVFTQDAPGPDGERIRQAVAIITELLISDHLKSASVSRDAEDITSFNELQELADRQSRSGSRFAGDLFATGSLPGAVIGPPSGRRASDSSSPVFLIDHSNCILCDRCIRACDEVKNNLVIGRTGKGRTTGIGFDLNDAMFESSCVQCGECMVSCPTSAITFKPLKEIRFSIGPAAEIIQLAELRRDPLFAQIPPKFLLWQKGLVVRRRFNAGEFLCRQGEPGHSAFLIKRGRLKVTQPGTEPIFRTVDDVIVGEMACISGMPRTADVIAVEDGEVWEIRRNVLDRMMRSPAQRELFESLYRERALTTVLGTSDLFRNLPPEEKVGVTELLKPQLVFVRASPGQILFQQGDLADCMYLIRSGHVLVRITQDGREATVFYRAPGTVIGEIGLLTISPDKAEQSAEEVDRSLRDILRNADEESLSGAFPMGQRSATCSALDHVELARIDRNVFLKMIRHSPTLCINLFNLARRRMSEA